MDTFFLVIFLIFSKIFIAKKNDEYSKYAVVTLVTGNEGGYQTGALALGQSIIEMGSKLRRVVMVTNDVESSVKEDLSRIWEVIEVKTYFCNHVHKLNGSQYDLKGERYQNGVQIWSKTCTKFAAWELIQFERVIFMDSDTLVVGPIDDLLFSYSNASFLAAPEGFPPDNFNSGVMVFYPSMQTHSLLLSLNKEVGSVEGGDQGVLNRGLCPHWFLSSTTYPSISSTPTSRTPFSCGRIPWIFNVEAAHFQKYKTLRDMAGDPGPSVVHFVSDGKPWRVLMLEYLSEAERDNILSDDTLSQLPSQLHPHLLWRIAFFLSQEKSKGLSSRKKGSKHDPNYSYKYLASLPLSDLLSFVTSPSFHSSLNNQLKISLLLSIHQGEYQIERRNKKKELERRKGEEREREKEVEKEYDEDEDEDEVLKERMRKNQETKKSKGREKEKEKDKKKGKGNMKESTDTAPPSSSCDCSSLCNSCPSEQPPTQVINTETSSSTSSSSSSSLPSFKLKFKLNLE